MASWTRLVGALFAAAALAACGTGSGQHRGRGSSTTRSQPVAGTLARPHSAASPAAGSNGDFYPSAITFGSASSGLVTAAFEIGYPVTSSTPYAWFDSTTDGGRTWGLVPVEPGEAAPAAQLGVAFLNAEDGWAYGERLYFTTDGGQTWQPENVPFITEAVATVGTSSWLLGISCAHEPQPLRSMSSNESAQHDQRRIAPAVQPECVDRVYSAVGAGGPLTALPGHPVGADVDVMQMIRISATSARALALPEHGPPVLRLVGTDDGGTSWRALRMPCVNAVSGALSTGGQGELFLTCAARSTSMCEECGTVSLYRSTDGGLSWTRLETPGSPYSCCLGPVQASGGRLWLLQTLPAGGGNAVYVSGDAGESWHRVLGGDQNATSSVTNLAVGAAGRAWALIFGTAPNGAERLGVDRTVDGGRTWQLSWLPVPPDLPH